MLLRLPAYFPTNGRAWETGRWRPCSLLEKLDIPFVSTAEKELLGPRWHRPSQVALYQGLHLFGPCPWSEID